MFCLDQQTKLLNTGRTNPVVSVSSVKTMLSIDRNDKFNESLILSFSAAVTPVIDCLGFGEWNTFFRHCSQLHVNDLPVRQVRIRVASNAPHDRVLWRELRKRAVGVRQTDQALRRLRFIRDGFKDRMVVSAA